MSDYEKIRLQEEAEDDWDKDWVPELEPVSLEELNKCPICHAIINEDGTVDDCLGECDLELSSRLRADEPLDFN